MAYIICFPNFIPVLLSEYTFNWGSFGSAKNFVLNNKQNCIFILASQDYNMLWIDSYCLLFLKRMEYTW